MSTLRLQAALSAVGRALADPLIAGDRFQPLDADITMIKLIDEVNYTLRSRGLVLIRSRFDEWIVSTIPLLPDLAPRATGERNPPGDADTAREDVVYDDVYDQEALVEMLLDRVGLDPDEDDLGAVPIRRS